MSVTVTLHLNFRGNARAALEFYRSVFGGELVLAPYAQVPAGQAPEQAEQLAWGQVEAISGFRIMAYDVQHALPLHPGENAYYASLRCTGEAELRRYWAGLHDGAQQIHQELGPAVFSPLYGKLTDRFGVTWIMDVIADHPS